VQDLLAWREGLDDGENMGVASRNARLLAEVPRELFVRAQIS
jgi:hypothetical protein